MDPQNDSDNKSTLMQTNRMLRYWLPVAVRGHHRGYFFEGVLRVTAGLPAEWDVLQLGSAPVQAREDIVISRSEDSRTVNICDSFHAKTVDCELPTANRGF